MQILALEVELPGATAADFAPLLKQEARALWELQQAGAVRAAYFRADAEAAVLLLDCAGVEEARRLLAGLPLVQAGLIDFDLIPLRAYPGFARLFAGESDDHPQRTA